METALTEIVIVIRLCLGFVAGAIIGFERSSRRQVAGLRTHVLICVGATLLMLLSIWIPQRFYAMKNGDPGRIAAQVVSGIGFLGAGAIIRLGHNVKGLTTAASLWLIAAVGLAIGAGMYIAAVAAEIIALATLVLLSRLEKRIFPAARHKLLELRYKHGAVPDTRTANDILLNFGIQSLSMDVDQNVGKAKNTKIRFYVSIPDATDISRLAKALKNSGEVVKVEIKEKY
jgi:putative Mg2+ transporter-C (MgtC) family protein